QLLLDPSEHAPIVDAFGGHAELAAGYRQAHARFAEASREFAELNANERAAKERLDYLQFQLKELEAANLREGEDAEIEAERMRLKHAVSLEEKSRSAEAALYGDAGSALESVDRAIGMISQCAEVDPLAAPWREALGRARAEMEEVARELARYAEKLESNPDRLEELSERLHLVRSLTRKHGGSVAACLARLAELKLEVGAIARYDEIVAEKQEALGALESARRAAAKRLADARRKAGEKLGKAVAAELAGLGMGKVAFKAECAARPETEWDESGPDRVEFLFSPNVGEPMRSLARIASGGELSRVMLAVKGALAGRAELAATSVFDEVDSGIGGAVAEVVGSKLKQVAKSRQVICITHLPQVAVHGDRHIRIAKRVEGGRTVAVLETLSADGRVEEIARMLGGRKITSATVAHAREMLELAAGKS
ncbi:MAG TPA: DNA repair protein RecN, partial [bacterium]|nr:DNA repair protein RecN [bacterium]